MDDIYERAVAFASRAHAGQKRKNGGEYILHPLETAAIVRTMTDDKEVLAAAVLHDTVEDTPVTAEEIKELFGERVAELVAHETENKRSGVAPDETWKIRKTESLAVLKDSDTASKMLWLGDKLSNMRSLARDYRTIGEAVFGRFHEKDPKEQYWYFATVLKYLAELSEYPAYHELEQLICEVFADYIGGKQ